MKKIYCNFPFYLILLLILAGAGCATVEEPKYVPIKDYEKRLEHAKSERDTLNRIIQNAQTVNEVIDAKERLENVQKQIEELETGQKVQADLDAGFESTEKRTVVYGPIGWVLIGSKWIVDKMFILYPWNWRAF